MSPSIPATSPQDLTPRQAALIAGIAYLLNPAPYGEYLFSKLLVPNNLEQTAQNTLAHPALVNAAILTYLLVFIGDIVIAWSLFYLVTPVHRALSALAALFQLVYAAICLAATLDLVTLTRILRTPAYVTALGPAPLHAQIDLLLHSFRWSYSFGLIFFGIHLALLGVLIVRSAYIPKLVGAALLIAGAGYIVDGTSTYILPDRNLGWLQITFAFELVFVFWLWIWGWRLRQPAPSSRPPAGTAAVLP